MEPSTNKPSFIMKQKVLYLWHFDFFSPNFLALFENICTADNFIANLRASVTF